MSGSLFSTIGVLIVGVAAVALTGGAVIWLVPIFLVALVPFFVIPMLRSAKTQGRSGDGVHGVPTTKQASYEPKFNPSDRPT